jgi:mono/diheme cytochrome c family protein
MHPNSHSNTFSARLSIALVLIAALALLSNACSGSSVVSTGGGQSAQANPAASPAAEAAAASPAPGATLPPSAVPTTPVGPIGQTAPSSGVTRATPEGERQEMRGNLPVTVSPAKPMMTPAPDPFPARPTPSVVMANGKIVQQWQAPADEAKQVNPMKGNADSAKFGREYYMQKCVDCHGKEGKGNGWMSQNAKRDGKPLPPTNLASKMVQANTDGELFWKITNGRSPMPAHRVRFDDDQRWHIVSFLRTFKE